MRFLFIGLLCVSINIAAQTGAVQGKVTDNETGEFLTGATVVIKNTTRGTISDFDGNYLIENIEEGDVTLVCSFVSYDPIEKTVNITQGNTVTISFELNSAKVSLDEVEVVAKANRESENILLLDQKESVIAIQSIGAQELSRKGVSDAEGAVTKISGISKQEGEKNVIIRGLGDRYNVTTFNGFPVPSEDPEYKNISLEFFSSDIIKAVKINKVFTSSHSGDVGGALIDITSKELIKSSEFEISASTGINSQTAGINFYKTDGVNNFGYAYLNQVTHPDIVEGKEVVLDNYNFCNSLDPVKTKAPVNTGFVFSSGHKFGNNRHNFYIVGNYNNKSYYEQGTNRNTTTTSVKGPFKDFMYDRYEQKSSHMVLGNLDFNFINHELSFNSLYIHTNTQYFAEYFGKEGEIFQIVEDSGSLGLYRRQQINDNSVFVNQLIWNWDISNRYKFEFGVSHNYLMGYEPDRRTDYLNYPGNDILEMQVGDGRHKRFFSELTNNDVIVKSNITYKLNDSEETKSSIVLGYMGLFGNKHFVAPNYNEDPELLPRPQYPVDEVFLDNFFNKENFRLDNFGVELWKDSYSVEKYINGGFLNLVYEISKKFLINAGIRTDLIFWDLDFNVNKGNQIDPDNGTNLNIEDTLFILPSINLKYNINDKHSIRLGLGRTYTLPQDKELAPFVYEGPVYTTYGNPNLLPSVNYNIDIKWDYYITNSEIITLNGFYKIIKDPIARIDKGSSAGFLTYDNISDKATAAGAELELKKNIISVSKGNTTHKFDIGFNGSYIYTNMFLDAKIIGDTSRYDQLEGAAPVISNTDLTYSIYGEKIKWINTVVLNYISDKVHTIGTHKYKNIIEESKITLDFVTSAEIAEHWKIGFKAKNLLNPYYQLTREPNGIVPVVILDQYKKGISYSLGLTYKF